jgi:hypothetical protein
MKPTLHDFQGIELHVMPDSAHGWLLSTQEVAAGYGVTEQNIREHKRQRPDELVEGKHWIEVEIETMSSVSNPDARSSGGNTNARNLRSKATLWTRRGVVRLGFFIRSKRAKLFRDWAEDLIIEAMTGVPVAMAAIDATSLIQLIQTQTLTKLFDQARFDNETGRYARGFLESAGFPRAELPRKAAAPRTCGETECVDRINPSGFPFGCSQLDCPSRRPAA